MVGRRRNIGNGQTIQRRVRDAPGGGGPGVGGRGDGAERGRDRTISAKGDVVLWLGDEVTQEGYFSYVFYEDLKRQHPDLVQQRDGQMPKDYQGPGLRFVNAGQNGETAAGGSSGWTSSSRTTSPPPACVLRASRFRQRPRGLRAEPSGDCEEADGLPAWR